MGKVTLRKIGIVKFTIKVWALYSHYGTLGARVDDIYNKALCIDGTVIMIKNY